MRPGVRALESRLRRRTRAELRASKESWKEFRRCRRAIRRSIPEWTLALLIPPLLIPQVGSPFTAPVVLLALTLYGSGTACLRALDLLRGLFASEDLAVLGHLPVSEGELFRLQDRKLFRRSLWVLYAFSMLLLGSALHRDAPPSLLAATAALALLQWIGVLGLALALAAWKSSWPFGLLGRLLHLLAFIALATAPQLSALPWVRGGEAFLCLPTGWGLYAFHNGLLGPSPLALLLLIPASALTLLPFLARRALRSSYVIHELVPSLPTPPADLILEAAVDREMIRRSEYDEDLVNAPERAPELREELRRVLPALAEQRLREGALTRAPDWPARGPLERCYAALLGPADRPRADLLLGGDLHWSRPWRRSAALALLGAGTAILLPTWIVGWPLALISVIVLWPLFPQKWPGLEPFTSAGRSFPFYAFFPIGYWDGSRILFKAALIRVGAWSPLILLLGAAFTARGSGPLTGLWMSAKGLLMVAALVPLLTMLKFSVGTDDTLRVRFGSLVCFLLPLLLATVAVFSGGQLLFGKGTLLPGAAIPPLLLLPAYGAWALFGVSYNRGPLDLIRPGPPG